MDRRLEQLLQRVPSLPDVLRHFHSSAVRRKALDALLAVHEARDATLGLDVNKMTHGGDVHCERRSLFVFLLDQSYSMEDRVRDSTQRKMDLAADTVNEWLENLVMYAADESGIGDCLDVAVLGYHTDADANQFVGPAFEGPLKGKAIASIQEIANQPAGTVLRKRECFDVHNGGLAEFDREVPVWVEPLAMFGTPMCTALYRTDEVVSQWIDVYRNGPPPVIVHITDGENQESANPVDYADPLKSLETDDGSTLFLNLLFSEFAPLCVFPHSGQRLIDDLPPGLFQMSSVLPSAMLSRALEVGFELQPDARCLVANADQMVLRKVISTVNALLPIQR